MKRKLYSRRIVRCIVAVVAVISAVFGIWNAFSFRPPPTAQNVILLVVDTLRADHLGCYGYKRPVSPNIDAVAETGSRYARSFSSSPWTLPSHASLFTGLFPYEHGAHTYLLEKPKYQKWKNGRKRKIPTGTYKLKNKFKTLAEYLSEEGYATGAVVGNVSFLSKRLNVQQGFDRYHVTFKRANELNDIAFRWIEEVKHREFFLFMNYMDTHRPYNTTPRPGLFDRPVDRDSDGLLDKLKAEVLGTHKDPVFPPELAERVIAQYDTAVANVDEEIGRMIDFLKRKKLYDNTLLIITSDHGEYFGEHFLVEHSKDVYQEALNVPLIIKGFHQEKGEVREEVVSSVDVPGIIVRRLDCADPQSGVRLFKRVPGNHSIIAENYFSRASDIANSKWGKRFKRIRAALFDWPYKFILSSDGRHEMYNLERDAKEARNLLPSEADRAEAYRKEISGRVKSNWKRNRPPAAAELSPLEIEQMRQLGYME